MGKPEPEKMKTVPKDDDDKDDNVDNEYVKDNDEDEEDDDNILLPFPVPGPVLVTHSNSPMRQENSLHNLTNTNNIDLHFDLDKISFDLPIYTDDGQDDFYCETSPKPSEAIDDEDDFVTLDTSVLALPSSIQTVWY